MTRVHRFLVAATLLPMTFGDVSLRADPPPGEPLETSPRSRFEPVPEKGRVVHPPVIDALVQPLGFTSVQVNVNADGMNIVGDAANEPSIAVDPIDPRRMSIGWRQFDTISSDFRQAGWGFSDNGGVTWAFPGVLTPGIFRSDPVLDFDSQGNFYYYSLFVDSTTWRCDMFISGDGGASWLGPIFGYGGDKAWFAIDRTGGIGEGNVYMAWNVAGNDYFPATYTQSTDGGLNYIFPIEIPERPRFGSVAVGPDSEVYVLGINDAGRFHLLRSDNAWDPDQTPTFDTVTLVDLGGGTIIGGGPNPAGLLGQAWIAVDHSDGPSRGHVYVLCSVTRDGPDPMDVMFARSTDRGVSFSEPVRVNDDPVNASAWQWFGTMSVAPNGRIDVVWNDTRNDQTVQESELFYAGSGDGGLTWSANLPVSPPFNHFLGYPQQNKLGDYYDMISHDDGAHVAYAATFNGEQDVYYLNIPAELPQIGFEYPDGRPEFIDPAGDAVRVVVTGRNGGEPESGTGMLHYDAGNGFEVVDMVEVEENVYDAVFPALDCGAMVAYYVSARSIEDQVVTDPAQAPIVTFEALVGLGLAFNFQDDFETDRGWTVESFDLDDGEWERGVPAGGGNRGDPANDYDGSGQCYLTGNEDGNSDVDGGPTRLTSPVLDATGLAHPFVRYARWFTNDDRDEDRLDVEISDDDGATWTLIESVPHTLGWTEPTFAIEDPLEPNDRIRLRFSATDNPSNSVTEAAIDAVAVGSVICPGPVGDLDGDGDVDFADIIVLLTMWGDCPDPPEACPADLDGDGMVGQSDLIVLLQNWS